MSPLRRCMHLSAQATGDPADHTNGAVPARAVTMPLPASVSCPCIRGSVLSLDQHQAPKPALLVLWPSACKGSRLSPASPVRLVEAWKCGAIHHSPHPAIQVAASFIGRVAVLPAACPIALDLMKQSHRVYRTLLKTHPRIFRQLFADVHQRKNKAWHLPSPTSTKHHGRRVDTSCLWLHRDRATRARCYSHPIVLLKPLCWSNTVAWRCRVRRRSSIKTFSIHPSQPSPYPPWLCTVLFVNKREASQCVWLLPLSGAAASASATTSGALTRVPSFRCRPVQERIHRHQLELLLAVSLIHNSSIERCRTFPDPVLTSLFPHCCRRQLSPPPAFRSVPSSVRFALRSPRS